jgi:predicted XRE-type DNA-binding protein
MNREIWKPIIGYENYYEVSNIGHVKRIQTGKILKPRISNGYCLVDLRANNNRKYCRIHRLVAFAFIGFPPTANYEVRHLDGDKQNNYVDNLTWGTRRDNERDKIRHKRTNRGQRNGKSKLTTKQVMQIKELLLKGNLLQRQIADIFGVARMTISDIKCGRSWRYCKG